MLGTPFSVCTLSLHKKSNHFKSIIRSLRMVAFFTFLYKQVLVLEKQVLVSEKHMLGKKKLMTAYLRVVFFFVADVFFVLEAFFVVVFFV